MKKIVFVLLIASLFFTRVYAKTYYSDYSEFSEYGDTFIEKSDEVDTEEKQIYHAYKKEKNIIYFDDFSIDDIEKRVYSEYVYDINDLDESKRYEETYEFTYNPLKDYNYLVLSSNGVTMRVNSITLSDERNDEVLASYGYIDFKENDLFIFKLYSDKVIPINYLKVTIDADDYSNMSLYIDDNPNPFDGMHVLRHFLLTCLGI